METMRIDKWLWAARFFKTRALAVEEIGKGRVQLNGHAIKPAHDVRAGDQVLVKSPLPRTVVVKGLSQQRGPAVVAQQLYEETEASLRERELLRERLRLQPEPAQTIEHGRPTKRDRRELSKTWDQRWSASIDD
ncbi:MAG: RNA-binding S4 domain-containing protein [Betaproteobacteria bacterium]